MSQLDQTRRFDDVPVTSALPLITDLRRKDRRVRNVPGPDLNHPDSQKLELSCGTGGVDWCLRAQITTYYF